MNFLYHNGSYLIIFSRDSIEQTLTSWKVLKIKGSQTFSLIIIFSEYSLESEVVDGPESMADTLAHFDINVEAKSYG